MTHDSRHFILDADNNIVPCDGDTWSKWFRSTDRKVMATHVSEEVTVSTVFLGLCHRFYDEGPPILFETLVFGGPLDGDQTRCCTWAEAEEQHKEMLIQVCQAEVDKWRNSNKYRKEDDDD